MSVATSAISSTRVSDITVTFSESTSATARAAKLIVGNEQHKLLCEANGTLRETFTTPILLCQADHVRLSVSYRKPWYKPYDTITLDTKVLLNSKRQVDQRRELQITQGGMRIIFGVFPEGQPEPGNDPVNDQYDPSDGTLRSTTRSILDICPRFRILVIGKTGVGKSTLINRAFGVSEASPAHYRTGDTNIETELISPENTRFVLHDSNGFEPGEVKNYEMVKRFISSRRSGALKDRLHAVWFCLEPPRAGTRLLESAAKDFLKSRRAMLETIPLIIVFTKYDEFINYVEMNMPDHGLEDEELKEIASSKAEFILTDECAQSIRLHAGESLPQVAVSTEEGYENTLPKLVRLTSSMVSQWVAHEPSVVSNMAQRVDPTQKIQGTINIGKRKYWKALRSSPNFHGYSVWECLRVIHNDIVRVWNFPTTHLSSNEFRTLMIDMVQELHVANTSDPTSVLTLGGGSLAAAITAVLAALANPAAPIVIPIVAGLVLGVWVYSVYQQSKVVQQRFIAYIVDLTHVMETLFIITAGRRQRMGRRAIKLAYKAYYNSELKAWAHTRIESYCELEGRDAALEMIERLLERDLDNTNYHASLQASTLDPVKLSEDEPW